MPAQDARITTTQVTAMLEQEWRPNFHLKANEERVVSLRFEDATEGVQKIGNILNLSKIGVMTAQELAGTGNPLRGALTFNDNVEENTQVTPLRIYSGMQVSQVVWSRMLRSPALRAGWKKQLSASLATKIDVEAGELVASLTTNVVGGAGQDITKALWLSGLAKLALNAKEYFKAGSLAYFCVYPLQLDDIMSIVEITSAEFRGDKENPIVGGWVFKAYNTEVNESGNIFRSGGVAHNLLHIPSSHVLGYNEENHIMPEQMNGLATIIIATGEFGVAEFNDEYAVDVQTKDT